MRCWPSWPPDPAALPCARRSATSAARWPRATSPPWDCRPRWSWRHRPSDVTPAPSAARTCCRRSVRRSATTGTSMTPRCSTRRSASSRSRPPGSSPPRRSPRGCWTRSAPTVGGPTMRPTAPGTDDDHCDDGSGTDFFTSDSNSTSYVVQALAARRSHVVGVGPVRVLRDGARSGPRRLVLLDRVHRHRRELDRPGAPGLHRRRRGDPDRWPEVVAHVAVPGVRRVGLHVGRRCEGRSRRGSHDRRHPRPVADAVPVERARHGAGALRRRPAEPCVACGPSRSV